MTDAPPALPGDSKDWTWVLERACPDCVYDAAAVDRAQVGAIVRDTAASWGAVLDRADARTRPDDATWSPLEYACHVRDVLRLYDERLRLMLEQDDPLYANWDQDASAVEGRYDLQDPTRVAGEVLAAAEQVAPAFRRTDGRAVGAARPPQRRRVLHRRHLRALLPARPGAPPPRRARLTVAAYARRCPSVRCRTGRP